MMDAEVPVMIASYRKQRGLTLEQLGDKLGVRWETIWRWEHGRRTPPGSLVQLALLGLDVQEGWQRATPELPAAGEVPNMRTSEEPAS